MNRWKQKNTAMLIWSHLLAKKWSPWKWAKTQLSLCHVHKITIYSVTQTKTDFSFFIHHNPQGQEKSSQDTLFHFFLFTFIFFYLFVWFHLATALFPFEVLTYILSWIDFAKLLFHLLPNLNLYESPRISSPSTQYYSCQITFILDYKRWQILNPAHPPRRRLPWACASSSQRSPGLLYRLKVCAHSYTLCDHQGGPVPNQRACLNPMESLRFSDGNLFSHGKDRECQRQKHENIKSLVKK